MVRFVKFLPLVALALAGLISPALAHSGHAGGLAAGLAHPFTGLDHMLAMVAVGLWASQLGRPAIVMLPLVFPVTVAAGAMLGANGVAMPWVDRHPRFSGDARGRGGVRAAAAAVGERSAGRHLRGVPRPRARP
jgi:hydrogenase/urease accessory protein HupE